MFTLETNYKDKHAHSRNETGLFTVKMELAEAVRTFGE